MCVIAVDDKKIAALHVLVNKHPEKLEIPLASSVKKISAHPKFGPG
jgi:hypothetical protein